MEGDSGAAGGGGVGWMAAVGHAILHPGARLPPPSLRKEIRTDSRAETACLESVSETVPSLHLGLVHGKKLIGLGAVRRLRSSLGSRKDVFEPVTETECLYPEETGRSQCNSLKFGSVPVDCSENRYDASRPGLGDFLAGSGRPPSADGGRGRQTRPASASPSPEAERQAQ